MKSKKDVEMQIERSKEKNEEIIMKKNEWKT